MTYYGEGTIIVNGNLIINNGVSIQPYPSDKIAGFIVLSDAANPHTVTTETIR